MMRSLFGLDRLSGSRLFDAEWYLRTYPDLHQPGGGFHDPAWHYLRHGAREGRDPGPGFSTSGYKLQCAALGRRARGNALLDFEARGRAFGLRALPIFEGKGGSGAGPVILFCAHQVPARQFGAERSFLAMLDRATRAGLGVEVVVPHCHDAAYLAALRERARRIHVIPYGWHRLGHPTHETTLEAMREVLCKSRAVEVHQNTSVLDAPLLAARRAGVPSVVYLRELPESDPLLCSRMRQSPATLRAALLALADRFVANSPLTARWIDPEGTLAPGRLVVLPNMIDPALGTLAFSPSRPPRVGLIGSLTAQKGILDLVKIARILAAHGERAVFRLIGPLSPDLAALGPLPANIEHAGYAPRPFEALGQIDVLLSLSSVAESFGRTVLEALAAGRPVICYDRGMPPLLLGQSGAGESVGADDPEAVARALMSLLGEPGRLEAASVAARKRAAEIIRESEAVPDRALFATAYGRSRQG